MNNKKYSTKIDMQRMLQEGKIALPPLKITCIELAPKRDSGTQLDALIEVRSGNQSYRFAIEMKALSTPKAFRASVNQIKSVALPLGTLPMIMQPYLNETQLRELEQVGVSGIDLCGNGIVMAPEGLFVFRSGQPNQYRSSAPIKNIYRRNTAMVPRVFLSQSQYDRVSNVLAAINSRNLLGTMLGRPPMGMGTVSKAIKGLEEDLIISRGQGPIKVIQPDLLLDKLMENCQRERTPGVIRRRISVTTTELPVTLAGLSRELNLPIVATGLGSVTRYAVMQRGELLSVYCPRPEVLLARLPGSESDRFPNLEIVPSDEEPVYFDSRLDEETGFRWASPVQTYLEMMRGDKRDQDTAVQLRTELIRQVRNMP